MNYIYDVLLNFNDSKRLYNFFEWDTNDNILNVKKVLVFRVSHDVLLDFIRYKVKVSKTFLKKIENTAIIYKQNKKKYTHMMILSDGMKSIGISFNDSGITEYKSNMLLEEEEEASFIASKSDFEKIEYKRLSKEHNENFTTRKELEEKEFIMKEINSLYKNNNIEKLKYLYIEYFDQKENNISKAYNDLIESLNSMDDKHIILYDLLKLTCKK